MPDVWLAGDGFFTYDEPRPARLVREVEGDGPRALAVYELEDTGEQVLTGNGRIGDVAKDALSVNVLVFHWPDDWDGTSPLEERSLRLRRRAGLWRRPEDAPTDGVSTFD